MNAQPETSVEELRVAVRQAFQKVAPVPQSDTSWWTTLFGEATQAKGEETPQADVNIEELRNAVREAFSKVASIPQADTSWWTDLFGEEAQFRSDVTVELPAYKVGPKAA